VNAYLLVILSYSLLRCPRQNQVPALSELSHQTHLLYSYYIPRNPILIPGSCVSSYSCNASQQYYEYQQ
jgi:hypothetical protein